MRRLAATSRHAALSVAIALTGLALLAACTSSARPHGASSSATGSSASSPTSSAASGAGSATAKPGPSSSARRTTVAPPSPGSIHQTVPSRTITTKAPVALTHSAAFGGGVSAKVTSIKAITAVAHGPGEIGGPALEVSLTITNGTARAVDLDNTVVNLYDSQHDPATSISGSPADPVTGSLAAGRSASGTYVFTIATSRRNPVTISVSYTASSPVVLFVGNAG